MVRLLCSPSVEDHWVMETRVPQVADLMSSTRVQAAEKGCPLLRQHSGPWPQQSHRHLQTLKQVCRRGDGCLQKEDSWRADAFEDGFMHDMVQGLLPWRPEQKVLGATSQIVAVPASTMSMCHVLPRGAGAVPQRSELRVPRDGKGQRNQKPSAQVHRGDGEEGCAPWRF